MLKVGVTGGIGSGKSLVCRMLSELGVPVFNSDDTGKELLRSPEVVELVVKRFGADVAPSGEIDRKKLAAVVFSTEDDALRDLEAIIHPKERHRPRNA